MSSPGPAEFAPWSLPVPLTLALILAAFVYRRALLPFRDRTPILVAGGPDLAEQAQAILQAASALPTSAKVGVALSWQLFLAPCRR